MAWAQHFSQHATLLPLPTHAMDQHCEWLPVDGALAAAAAELEVGQLLHASVFSLFEAMSAVEIGNPKMDAGARPKGDTTPLQQRALATDLPPQRLLAVLDHLLCLEAAWHSGGALARTVYSSLYMMQPERTAANATLSAYCAALQATCAEVNQLVMTGGVCEEEDFNAHIGGLPLESALTAAGAPATGQQQQHASPATNGSSSSKKGSAAAAAAAAEAAAAAKVESVLAALSHAIDGQSATAAAAAAQKQQQQPATAAAVVARLQFRKLLLQGLIRLKRRHKQDLDQAAKLFLRAQAELATIQASLELSGLPETLDGAGSSSSSQAGGSSTAVAPLLKELCWDENMNNHLIPAVPPRSVKVPGPAAAVQYFERLLSQLVRVCSVTTVNSYSALKRFVIAFMDNGGQGGFSVCPVSRSALHSQVAYTAWVPLQAEQQQQEQPAAAATAAAAAEQLHHSHIQQPHTAAAGGVPAAPPPSPAAPAALAPPPGVVLPAWTLSPRMVRCALLLSPDEELGDEGDLFIEQAVIATGNFLQALLMNPSRCRRRLRRGLEDWANLYQHALNADCSPGVQAYMTVHGWEWAPLFPEDVAGPLATWVEVQTAGVMVRHLLMGFELQLYEPVDYAMIYWYVDAMCGVVQAGTKLLQARRPVTITSAGAGAAGAAAAANGPASPTTSTSGSGSSPKLPSRGGKRHGGSKAAAATASSPGKGSRGSGCGGGGGSSSGGGAAAAAAAAATAAALQAQQQQAMQVGMLADVSKQLCMGVLRVQLAFPLLGMFDPPEWAFNGMAQRYDQRFATFHTLQRPDPLVFDQYVASTDVTGATPEQLLRLAAENFHKALQVCSLLKGGGPVPLGLNNHQQDTVGQLERVAATNRVAVTLLLRSAAAAADAAGGGAEAAGGGKAVQLPFKPLWEFGVHKWFPTLVLKSAAAAAGGK